MAPPAPTVVVASVRPMAAPRRRGRSQARSLGVVVTLRDPLGTPKLQTGPSAALVSSFLRAQVRQRSTDLSSLEFASFQTAPT